MERNAVSGVPRQAAPTGKGRAQGGAALLGGGLGGGRSDRLRLDRADDQLGVGRARGDVELDAVALAVAVEPGGADLKPGALLPSLNQSLIELLRHQFQPNSAQRCDLRPLPLPARSVLLPVRHARCTGCNVERNADSQTPQISCTEGLI